MRNDARRTTSSRAIVLAEPNIDTDQIIPARFLTTVDRDGLAQACFADWRLDASGDPVGHELDRGREQGREFLVAGENFGCGSSREHAAWALLDFGIRAVITTRAADIFKSNALKNALLVVEVEEAFHAHLCTHDVEIEIDVAGGTVRADGREARFDLEPFARTCLLEGTDALGHILGQEDAIARFEAVRVS
ncbi:3-isopropylmalate dehydratase small subunit [Marinicauda algicola]|uniref:3-isopropylmalate dehydratase n=1 Tax=Marinicauda algicola TaxID=2029849 RepID=A0A4V3RY79_9PROT|nr:3-isopropylmalate dehydratase small subunit [Marinicauda algicola]TGY89349.1 3-isopropylmalate dehydratase small subunit [Marinicauda algicola]